MLGDLIRVALGLVLSGTAVRDCRAGTAFSLFRDLNATKRPLMFWSFVAARVVVGTALLAVVVYDWVLVR